MQNIQTDFVNGFKSATVSLAVVLPNIPRAIVAFLVGFIIVKLVSRFVKRALRWTNWPLGLQEILETLIRFALWIFLLITIFQILELTNVALAISGSFVVLLLGFAGGISAAVSDLMAGLQLANDKDFKVGYRVIAGDRKTEGIIREMDIKKTRIEDDKAKLHVIPNGLIEKNEWIVVDRHVHTQMPRTASAIIKDKLTKKVNKK